MIVLCCCLLRCPRTLTLARFPLAGVVAGVCTSAAREMSTCVTVQALMEAVAQQPVSIAIEADEVGQLAHAVYVDIDIDIAGSL